MGAVVSCLGWGAGGVGAGSCAACIQSCCYGGYVPLGSCFACLQSAGARGTLYAGPCSRLVFALVSVLVITLAALILTDTFPYIPAILASDHELLAFAEPPWQPLLTMPTVYKITIAVGVFMLLSSINMCFNVITLSMVTFVLVKSGIGVGSYNSSDIETVLENNLLARLEEGEGRDWARLQAGLHCCGVESAEDWAKHRWRTLNINMVVMLGKSWT